jgi:hypothetical protein
LTSNSELGILILVKAFIEIYDKQGGVFMIKRTILSLFLVIMLTMTIFSPVAAVEEETMFGDLDVLALNSNPFGWFAVGNGIYDLGTTFRVSTPGNITRVRSFVVYYWNLTGDTFSMDVRIWNADTEELISGPHTWTIHKTDDFPELTSKWLEYTLPSPVHVEADTTYMVSMTPYDSSESGYSYLYNFNEEDETYGNITIIEFGAYVAQEDGGFPDFYDEDTAGISYLRDIVFVADSQDSTPDPTPTPAGSSQSPTTSDFGMISVITVLLASGSIVIFTRKQR